MFSNHAHYSSIIYFILSLQSRPQHDVEKELFGFWDEDKRLQTTLMEFGIVLRRLNLENYEIPICYVLTDNDSINHLFDNV